MTDQKLAIITGAAGEVGSATARMFAAKGWSLVLCDRAPGVERLASEIAIEYGQSCTGVLADLASDEDIDRVVGVAAGTGIPLCFLGLVAAINHAATPVEHMDMSLWDRVHAINLRSNVKFISSSIPLLRRGKNPSIVLVSSFWGREGHAFFSPYCTSKAALISLTQSAAAELAPDIRVNCVAPGNIDTPMHYEALAVEAKQRNISMDQMRQIEWAKIPMHRPAKVEEIASAIHFLTSEAASYFVGATLDANGGCRFT